jgi:integrase
VGFATGAALPSRTKLTVADAVEHWLEGRRGEIKKNTLYAYELAARTHVVKLLGHLRVTELTTAQIRRWHAGLTATVSAYTANVARKHLRVSLALAAEDFNLRVAAMPTRLGRGRPKAQKVILEAAHVAKLLRQARSDPWGLYYAWPFLTGTRPSEQLGLQWEDLDLEERVIRIRRVLERDGTLSDTTKTAAGKREVLSNGLELLTRIGVEEMTTL